MSGHQNQEQLFHTQFAFFDFCLGKCHHIVVHALVEAVKVMPQKGIVWVEAAKVTAQIRFLPRCGYKVLLNLFFGMSAVEAR